jgi:hypothetical protein
MNFVVMNQFSTSVDSYFKLFGQVENCYRSSMRPRGLCSSHCELLLTQPAALAVFDFWEQKNDYYKLAPLLQCRQLEITGNIAAVTQIYEFELVKMFSRESVKSVVANAYLIDSSLLSENAYNFEVLRSGLGQLWQNSLIIAIWFGRNIDQPDQFLLHLLWNNLSCPAQLTDIDSLLLTPLYKAVCVPIATSLPLAGDFKAANRFASRIAS